MQYEYDQGGNILSKKKYVNGALEESKAFTYGNANWRDQLTAVDGVAITYDQIGNPLDDGTWTYTWQNGRQLARMQSVDIDASFVYNENGLRVQKTVNGIVTDYTLHGKNVVHMTQGNDELHFFYDAQNKPAVVVYNGVPYSYVKNLQGDVVALLNSAGAVVVSYVYDAWGRPISKTGTLASTLGTVQPFRYRGYVYDEETEEYYLCTRYYSPEMMRFVNSDLIINQDAVLGGNCYCYVSNSPICCIDDSGAIVFTLVGGLIGFGCQAVSALCQRKSAREVTAAGIRGAVSGAINGMGHDILVLCTYVIGPASLLAEQIVSVTVGALEEIGGAFAEYVYLNGTHEGFGLEEALVAAIQGAIAGFVGQLSSEVLENLFKQILDETYEIYFNLLCDYGIENTEILTSVHNAYARAWISNEVFNATVPVADILTREIDKPDIKPIMLED